MRARWLLAALCALVALGQSGRADAASVDAKSRVRSVVIGPQAVTLRPGDTVQLVGVALDRRSRVLPGERIRWRSSQRRVATVDSTGLLTGVATGRTFITARAGKRQSRIAVTVVRETRLSGLATVNHVVADEEALYWTERTRKVTRVRRMPLAGGPILDLATDPGVGPTGLEFYYLDIRLIGNRVYWSIFVRGFEDHYAVFSVPKGGGVRTGIVPYDSANLVASAWQACGKYLVTSVNDAARISDLLPANTRVAAFDTETRQWRALVRGVINRGVGFVVAADDKFAYVRGLTEQGDSVTLRVDPADGANTYEELHSMRGLDPRLAELGASTGTTLFYWSASSTTQRLLAVPVDLSDSPREVLENVAGVGLTTDGNHVYWVRANGGLVRVPVAGGGASLVTQNVAFASSAGGLAQDATSLYVVRVRQGNSEIDKVAKPE